MFRHHSGNKKMSEDQFVSRLCSLPVMTTALGQLSSLYTTTKQSNRLLRVAMETAESGVHVVVDRAGPIVTSKLERPITALNDLACDQLDKLENCYPIITKPTDHVIKEARDMLDAKFKPLVDRVWTAKQCGVDKVNGAKTYTYDTIGGMKAYTFETIGGVKTYGVTKLTSVAQAGQQKVTWMMDGPYGRRVVAGVDGALTMADQYIDSYLPEDENGPKFAEVDEVSQPAHVFTKAATLTAKLHHRAYARAARRLRTMQTNTRETLDKLNFTVEMMQYARTNLDTAKTKAHSLWDEVNKTDAEVAQDVADEKPTYGASSFERQAVATARQLTQKLKGGLAAVGIPLDTLPDIAQANLKRAQELARSLLNIFSVETVKSVGVPHAALDRARTHVHQIHDSVNALVDWAVKMSPVMSKAVVEPAKTEFSHGGDDGRASGEKNDAPLYVDHGVSFDHHHHHEESHHSNDTY